MSLKLVVLGAGGLVGVRLCELLVSQRTLHVSAQTALPLKRIVLFDMKEPKDVPRRVLDDPRVDVMSGDLTDRATLQRVLAPNGCSRVTCIQLAALLSGYAESDFDLGMKVNLQGAIGVMEEMRAVGKQLGGPQIYLFCSTDYVAAYNERNKTVPVTEESFRLSPVSYGVQKACVELLLCDYTRKGFVDGRVGRLSAVLGRPGWSNSISWSWTGIFTQTLEGKDFEVPGVLPMDRPYPCSCVRNNVRSLLHLASAADAESMGHNRVVQVPAKSFTLADVWEACQAVAKEEGIGRLGKVTMGELPKDATVKELNVCPRVDCSKALALGCPNDIDIKEIIRDYVHVHVQGRAKL
eukprot:TRINITY_DN1630_c0_g1_i1.p1 TRINITY_DN1630_c0_g1~~TRINITY_DN1630_c0_g1_i1.p1  ORF type:complete len:352 (+),score=139.08 TRINITY_DN1630_c0_g1_i1:66-1121(+)